MKWNKKLGLSILALVLVLALMSDVSAQRRRYDRGGYRNNNYAYNYRPSRPYVSVNIGRPYNYNYRPYSYARPVYRSSYSYVHFGPSFGVRINALPFGYYPVYVGNNPYYYNDGVYYRPYNGGGYEVTAPPLGATVKRLPSGAKVTVIDGVKYYELGGTFYQEEITDKNKLRYIVVGTDGVLNTGATDDTNTNGVAPNNITPDKNTVTPQNNTNLLPEVGTRFDKLPEGSKTVVLKKEKYYVSPAGVYYQEVIDGNTVRYEVTGNSETEK
jgi:Family of unknown function (DUF6515)